MATKARDTPGDLLETPAFRRWAFTAPQVAFLVGFVLPINWRAIIWPVALGIVGIACVENARRCGRLHCYFTGPFFLASAAILIAYRFGMFGNIPGGWDGLGLGIVVVATILNVVPERLWGRYQETNFSRRSR